MLQYSTYRSVPYRISPWTGKGHGSTLGGMPIEPDDLVELVAQRIDQLRRERKWSQEEFAHQIGVSVKYGWRVLHGENLRLKTLAKLCQKLGIEPADLLRTRRIRERARTTRTKPKHPTKRSPRRRD